MKTESVLLLAATLAALNLPAQTPPATLDQAKIMPEPVPNSLVISEVGANHRTWVKLQWTTNTLGEVTVRTNAAFTELATGLHVFDAEKGQWVASRPEIQLLADGAAVTTTQYKVAFAADANSPAAIDLTLPDGQRLRSRIAALSYADTKTGKVIIIGEPQSSIGLLTGTDQVIYTNVFSGGTEVDLQYVVSLAGLEQNVIWRALPEPSPEELGLSSDSVWLQVTTAFSPAPMPAKTTEASGFDAILDFGSMMIPPGKAFLIGTDGLPPEPIPVKKQWVAAGDVTYLVEEVPYSNVVAQVRKMQLLQPKKPRGAALPRPRAGQDTNGIAALIRALPDHPARTAARQMQLARLDVRERPGFLLDFTILGNSANQTFKGDTTYYVSGLVNLTGVTTIEGGSVIKFTNLTTAGISMSGPLICQTAPYRPASLTSKDDRTLGENITASTGNPTNTGATYLASTVSSPTNAVQCLRLSYAGTGLSFDGLTNGVWHCQFVKCGTGIDSPNGKEVRLYNVLLTGLTNGIANASTVRGQHLTADGCTNLLTVNSAALSLTNSLLTGVGVDLSNQPTYDQVVTATSGGGIYQTVGAGGYYLVDGSTNRNTGTTNLHTTLAKDLRSRTTHPPLLLLSNITTATVLSPQAQRDTDLPDLGWHYAPLDYVANGRSVSATLTLTNGVALGTYGSSSSYGLGVSSKIVSQGSPTALNWIARYNTVQEQANTNWSATSVGPSILISSSSGYGQFRFTGFSLPGGTGDHFNGTVSATTRSYFTDCQFGGGGFTAYPNPVGLTNSLWERVNVTLRDNASTTEFYLFNNLFWGGALTYVLLNSPTGLQTAQDNFFDQTTISKGAACVDFPGNNNGYVTNYSRLTASGTGDVTLTNAPTYLTSWLGRYYYPTSDGMLSRLIDVGSRSAASAALYHYTTTTSQTKEASSTVDIGFHFLATDANGVPGDYDGDGVPDYLEDRNGNGTVESGETDWNDPNDLGLRIIITRPSAGGPLP